MILIAGCANVEVREASTVFADYEVEEDPAAVQALELPALHEVEMRGDEVVMTSEAFNALREFEEAAHTNTEALKELSAAHWRKEREVFFLVMTGRQVEQESALFRQMYLNEAQQCHYYRFGAYGAGGLVLLFAGLAI